MFFIVYTIGILYIYFSIINQKVFDRYSLKYDEAVKRNKDIEEYAKESIESHKEQLSEAKAKVDEISAANEKRLERIRILKKQIKDKTDNNQQARAKINKKVKEVDESTEKAKIRYDKLVKRMTELKKQYDNIKNDQKEKSEEYDGRIDELTSKRDELRSTLDDLNGKIAKVGTAILEVRVFFL